MCYQYPQVNNVFVHDVITPAVHVYAICCVCIDDHDCMHLSYNDITVQRGLAYGNVAIYWTPGNLRPMMTWISPHISE